VAKAAGLTARKNKNLKFCFIDMYSVRTEEEFYEALTREVLNATSNKMEEAMRWSGKFISSLIPAFTISPKSGTQFSFSLNWKEVKKNPADVINLPQKIAAEKKINLVICIDEFQQINEFENTVEFQKRMRALWQKHKNVTYCLYGSKRHMLMNVFTNQGMPFYKFGDILFLEKIKEADWVKFITERFNQTGKKIDPPVAALIAQCVENHPYYVQQLAQQSWLRTIKACKEAVVMEAFDSLVLQLSLLFQSMTDGLSDTQVNFLRAVLQNVEQLSAKAVLDEYKLGTSANVQRIKEALVNKEILDIQGEKISFMDPVYKQWLKKHYFRIHLP
jgi:uncharacterized protein